MVDESQPTAPTEAEIAQKIADNPAAAVVVMCQQEDEILRLRNCVSSMIDKDACVSHIGKNDTQPVGRKWRHVKRGTVYQEVCRAELQATREPTEGEQMVVYCGDDGKLWVRAAGEFNDGRFEEVPAT